MSKKKFFPAEREGTIKGKRAKEQRAIQESWGGNSQDENQYRCRPPRPSHSRRGSQSDTT